MSESAFYDDVWRKYASLDAVSPAAFHRRRLVIDLARAAAPRAGRILDVGCGQGELLGALAQSHPGAEIAGADLSAQSIADTRRNSPDCHVFVIDLLEPEFDRAHAGRLGQHDLVTCCEVIEHLPDDELAVRRLAALLAPGGVLIVTVPGGRMSRFDRAIGHRRHYGRDELRRLLATGGLQTERVLAWGFPFHTAYRGAVRLASRLAIPEPRKGAAKGTLGASVVGEVLGRAYRMVGRGLRPLFFLNLSRWGEQLLAVARRPS